MRQMTEGLLQEIPLAEVIQLIAINAATGDLELMPLFPAHQPRERMPVGHLYFRDGHPHAAFLGERAREAAVENMFLWEAGFFTFAPRAAHDLPPANLSMETHTLILHGITRQDRWHRACELVPTVHTILQRTTPAVPAPPPAAHTPEAQILAQFDGQASLAGCAARARLGRLRAREAAANLLRAGFAALVPPSAGERLARLVAQSAYPMLGVAAELFCDDALRAAGMPPELLERVTTLSVAAVAQVVSGIETGVAAVLGPQRAGDLAERLRLDLGISGYVASERGVQHV
jgi:hypothetical protein